MASPAKILLFALIIAAGIAYYGEQIMLFTNLKGNEQKISQPQNTQNGLVYADTNVDDIHGEIRIPKGRDGHYWVTVDINSIPVRFVVDTGATHVSLSYHDAKTAGLDPDILNYNRIFNTANGDSRKAIVKLDRLALQSIQFSNITAAVSPKGQMNVSLLGMSFLDRLSGFRVENGELILTP